MQRIVITSLLLVGSVCSAASGVDGALDFSSLELKSGVARGLPELQPFEVRDGTILSYRHYPSESDTVLILLHGSSTHSAYLYSLAHALSSAGVAAVYTPDIRGHGPSPVRRGDIDYVDQLEDDLADLISHIEAGREEVSRLIVAGHSSGGGLAVRFAGSQYGELASAYILLAPYLGHDAPTTRSNSGGWADPDLFRIVPISILNELGISLFNGVHVLRFNLPPAYRTQSSTLSYSYRLMTGFGSSDFRQDLRAADVPLLVLVGKEDETLHSAEFERSIKPLTENVTIKVLNDVSHLEIVSEDPAARSMLKDWLEDL